MSCSESPASPTNDTSKLRAALDNVTLEVNKETKGDVSVNVDSKQRKKGNIEDSPKETNKNVEWEQLLVELGALQCPFNWVPGQIYPSNISHAPEKIIAKVLEMQEEKDDDKDFQWRKLVLNLVLCYEYHRLGDLGQAGAKQKDCESTLASFSRSHSLMETSEAALSHIVLACKAHLLHAADMVGETKLLLSTLQPYGEMSDKCLGCVAGMHGAIMAEYGYKGTKDSVMWIEQAIDLDPDQGMWHYLLGKSLGQLRRVETYNTVPEKRELKALERAVELTRTPIYMIFLAQAYREAACRVYTLNRDNIEPLKLALDQMNQRSCDLYSETLKLKPNCAHINVRCALGFLKLPVPFKDVRLAKECADYAWEISPNNLMVIHTLGTIHNYLGNTKLALKYLKEAGQKDSYGAWMDYIQLKYSQDNNYNPLPDLETILTRFLEDPRKHETLCQYGGYHLFIKNNLVSALEPWLEVARESSDSNKMKNFKSIFLPMRTPINLLDVILDESRLALEAGGLLVQEIEALQEAVQFCQQLNPDAGSPKPRRQMALDDIPPTKVWGRRGFRDHRGRGRGSGRGTFRASQEHRNERKYDNGSNEGMAGNSLFGKNRGKGRPYGGRYMHGSRHRLHSEGTGAREDPMMDDTGATSGPITRQARNAIQNKSSDINPNGGDGNSLFGKNRGKGRPYGGRYRHNVRSDNETGQRQNQS